MKNYLYLAFILFSTQIFGQFCEPRYINLGIPALETPRIFKGVNDTYLIVGIKDKNIINFLNIKKDGSIITSKETAENYEFIISDIKQLKDGSLVILVNFYFDKFNLRLINSKILRIDQNGNIIWTITDNEMELNYATEGNNNDLYLAGQVYEKFGSSNNYTGIISKISQSGTLIKKFYTYRIPNHSQLENSIKNKSIAVSSDGKVIYTLVNEDNAGTVGGTIGQNYLVVSDTSLKNLKYTELTGNQDHVSEFHYLNINSNKTYSLYLKPHRGFIDGSPNLFIHHLLDKDGLPISSSEIHNCGQSILSAINDNDSTYLIFTQNKILRYKNNNILISSSTLLKDRNFSNFDNCTLVRNSENNFTITSNLSNNLYLINYEYFGNDCLTKVICKAFYDRNENCLYDNNEPSSIPLEFNSDFCQEIKVDDKGNFIYPVEYGLNLLSIKYNENVYQSNCLKNKTDTIYNRYPENPYTYNVPLHKKNKCFLPEITQYYRNILTPGGQINSYIFIKNHSDTILRNIHVITKESPEIILDLTGLNFKKYNDTIDILIDSLNSDSIIQFQLKGSIDCNLPINTQIEHFMALKIHNPCIDTFLIQSFNLNGILKKITPSEPSLVFNSRRPCTELKLDFSFFNNNSAKLKDVKIEIANDPSLKVIDVSKPFILLNNNYIFTINTFEANSQYNIKFIDSISCNSKLGDKVCLEYKITYLRCDTIPDTIINKQCISLTNSYDPNYIESDYRRGNICYRKSPTLIPIDYYVQFQNEGNDTAINVFVYDTISASQFTIQSFDPDPFFKPNTYKIIQDSIIEFKFSNINLPPRSKTEYSSRFNFGFSISAKLNPDNINNATPIKHRVGVVFDNNTPVVTEYDYIYSCESPSKVNDINHKTKPAIDIIPNPTNGKFRIEANGLENIKGVDIFNLEGKLIQRFNISDIHHEIKLENSRSGIYYLRIITQDSTITVPIVVN